jgi:ring-1,2-phenylacetyl-CoA epoxidase subunit PaaB
MSDSQGPVWQVFERPAHGHPVRAAGSVHAVDAETAMQNAWAVYGRRPTAVALWVVPRSLVLTKSRDEFASLAPAHGNGGGSEQTYCVFCRCGTKIAYEESPSVLAATAEQALARAIEQQAGTQQADDVCHAIWVFPAAAIISSESPTAECSFSPQPHKWFRDHKSFPTGALMREIEKEASKSEHA